MCLSFSRYNFLLFFCLLGCLPLTGQNGLRDLASPKKVYIGNIISNGHLDNPTTFRSGEADAHLIEEYNTIVLENYMKMSFILPGNEPSDIHSLTVEELKATLTTRNIERFLGNNDWADLRKRGHAMIWFNQAPGWLNAAGPAWTGQQVFDFSRKYIMALGQVCGDRVDEWDVINEAISDQSPGGQREWRGGTWYRRANDGSMTDWGEATYENYIKMLFVWAREAQPQARLYYNDYSIEHFSTSSASKNHFMRDKFKALKDCGAPIDGIGFQSHFVLSDMVSSNGTVNQGFIDAVETSMTDLAAAGLDVVISELDIRICNNSRPEAYQESAFREFSEMALSQPNCRELLVWGLRDEDSWITVSNTPPFDGCQDATLVEGPDYAAKAAYDGLAAALMALPNREEDGFAELNPGNGAPADCGGSGSLDPSITAVSGPVNISPGDQITVSVSYFATEDQDVFVTFQLDSDPYTVYTEVVTDVTEGNGTVDVVLNIPESTPPGTASYQYQTFITPNGGSYSNRFGDLAQTDVTVLGGETQAILSSMGPEAVNRGDTVTVEVTYQAGDDQEIVVWFQLDEAPYTTFQEFRQEVTTGEGQISAKLFIPADVPVVEDAYQYQTILVPNGGGWEERISNVDQRDIDVLLGTGVDNETFGGLRLNAYPNPTNGLLYLELAEGSQKTSYDIYSSVGRLMQRGRIPSGVSRANLDVANLPPGVYILHLQQGAKMGRIRLVRE